MKFYRDLTVVLSLAFFTLIACSGALYAWPFPAKKKEEKKTVLSAPKSVLPSPVSAGMSTRAPKVSVPSAPRTSAKLAVPVTSAAPVSSDAFFDDEEDYDDEDYEEEDAEEADPLAAISQLPVIPKVPKVPTVASLTGVPNSPQFDTREAIPAAVKVDPEILKIQQQIQDIIKINENLKSHYTDQAAEIQKISEQAKIHQKILRDLEETRKLTASANAENYLNQEKVRLIQAETKKNQDYINTLKDSGGKDERASLQTASGASKPQDAKKS